MRSRPRFPAVLRPRPSALVAIGTLVVAAAVLIAAATVSLTSGAGAIADSTTAAGPAVDAPDVRISAMALPTPVTELAAAPPETVTVVGDSLTVSARPWLDGTHPSFSVDAAVGRQFSTGVAVIERLREREALGDVVVVALGTNGPISARDLDAIRLLLADVPDVIFVNVRVPRPWEDRVNFAIATTAAAMDNARVVDWHGLTEEPELADAWLAGDGYHHTRSGAQAFADVIRWAVLVPAPGADTGSAGPRVR